MKHELHIQKNAQAQKNIDALLPMTEAQAGKEYKGSTSGLARGHAKSLSLGEMLVPFHCHPFLLEIHHLSIFFSHKSLISIEID